MWALRHWCNQARFHGRQRTHIVPHKLDLSLVPDRVITQENIDDWPAALAKTDVELDAEAAAADAAAAAAAEAAALPGSPGGRARSICKR